MERSDIEKAVRRAIDETLSNQPAKKCTCIKNVSLNQARALMDAVADKAEGEGLSVVIAVCDSGANTVAVQRMDGAYIASIDIAVNKAYTSAALKMSTSDLGVLAAPGGELYGIQHTNNGKIVIFGGGQPLIKAGKLMGAVGVSGGTLAQDTMLAEFAKGIWEEQICR